MSVLNRQTRYEVIKELINIVSPEIIEKLIKYSGFKYDSTSDNIENKRERKPALLTPILFFFI